MSFIKEIAKKILMYLDMPYEYFMDFRQYKRWNYNNKKVETQSAYEAKILRLAHVLEKGMSLSSPHPGYGKEKIKNILHYIEKYTANGFDQGTIAYQNAISVLKRYIDFQKTLNYVDEELEKKVDVLNKDLNLSVNAGVLRCTAEELAKAAHSEFPDFFMSRHSLRQFSSKEIDLDLIRKAVELARKAPSACNRQSCKVYCFNSSEVNKSLGQVILGNKGFDNEVQKYLVITSDMSAFYDPFERNQVYVDGGIFALALIEALHYYGIGSCILQNGENYHRDKKFRKIMSCVPEHEKIILFIAIGCYKDSFNVAVSQRKAVDEVLKVI